MRVVSWVIKMRYIKALERGKLIYVGCLYRDGGRHAEPVVGHIEDQQHQPIW